MERIFAILVFLYPYFSDLKDPIVSDPIRQEKAKQIVNYLKEDNYSEVYNSFHPLVKSTTNSTLLQQGWSSLLVQLGEFEKIISIAEFKNLNYNVVLVRCQFKRDNANVELTFNDDNKLIGLYYKP